MAAACQAAAWSCSSLGIALVSQPSESSILEFSRAPGAGTIWEQKGSLRLSSVFSPVRADLHGTFVADELAGTTYGVAKAAWVVPVKTLDCHGIGELSQILAGLEWMGQNATGPSVVNMSLTANAVFQTVFDAIASLASQGITTVVAAGNGFNAPQGPQTFNACKVSPAGAPSRATSIGPTTMARSMRSPWLAAP